MAPKKCYYGDCKSDTRLQDGANLKYFRYPNPKKRPILFENWLNASGWDSASSEKFSYSKTPRYVCSKHFVNNDGPSKVHPNPIKLAGKVVIWNDRRKAIMDNVGIVPVTCNQTSGDFATSSLSNDSYLSEEISVKAECDSSNVEDSLRNSSMTVTRKRNDPYPEEAIITKTEQINNIKKEPYVLQNENVIIAGDTTPFSIDLFNNTFGCPKNWTTFYGAHYAKYSKEKGDVLELSFLIFRDQTTCLTVLGKEVPSTHFILEEIGSKVEAITDVPEILEIIEKFCVCSGNKKSDFPNILSFGRGVYNILDNAYHSTKSVLLFEKDGRVHRCKYCKQYRNVLRKAMSRKRDLVF